MSAPFKYVIGIDEVGRGPLAGPVAVGAFVFLDSSAARRFRGVKDSKQLSHEQREVFFTQIEAEKAKGAVDFSVTFVSEKVIDKKGLSFAIKFALKTSLDTIYTNIAENRAEKTLTFSPAECHILLDGGLKAPLEFSTQKTIIKGDEKEKVIALASIAAKVLRDRKMQTFSKRYPNYDFHIHKGYGTRGHYQKILQFGLCPLHRRSFLKKLKSYTIARA